MTVLEPDGGVSPPKTVPPGPLADAEGEPLRDGKEPPCSPCTPRVTSGRLPHPARSAVTSAIGINFDMDGIGPVPFTRTSRMDAPAARDRPVPPVPRNCAVVCCQATVMPRE